MDRQLRNQPTSPPNLGSSVSIHTAVSRATIGLAVGVVLILTLGLIYSDSDGLLAILVALTFLQGRDDRRLRWALGAAAVTAVPAAFAAAAVWKGWLPQPWNDFLFAGLGALLGSIAYAIVTQTGLGTVRSPRAPRLRVGRSSGRAGR
ncbi:hypothetical protein V6V47_11700 [Micromonospora sp. CPCC 205539]|uniref:hypothetical protein n=1 Tax=Micromonospora sp. CPCC 205539 TaxID=3122408 RepID=UPI002FF43547